MYQMILLFVPLIMIYKSHNFFYMALGLLLFSLSVSLLSGVFVSSWLFISLFMVFVGGMMILFFYIITLSDSEKNKMIFMPFLEGFVVAVLYYFVEFNQTDGFPSLILDLYLSNNSIALYFLSFGLMMCLFTAVSLAENYKGAISCFFKK